MPICGPLAHLRFCSAHASAIVRPAAYAHCVALMFKLVRQEIQLLLVSILLALVIKGFVPAPCKTSLNWRLDCKMPTVEVEISIYGIRHTDLVLKPAFKTRFDERITYWVSAASQSSHPYHVSGMDISLELYDSCGSSVHVSATIRTREGEDHSAVLAAVTRSVDSGAIGLTLIDGLRDAIENSAEPCLPIAVKVWNADTATIASVDTNLDLMTAAATPETVLTKCMGCGNWRPIWSDSDESDGSIDQSNGLWYCQECWGEWSDLHLV